jgi:stage V sporulation protein S
MEYLKVSSKSSPSSVAGAIAGMIKDGVPVEIQSVGAGAVNQAIKAIAIARGFLAPVGIEIVCAPAFADVEINGEIRTAIRFSVEPRYLRGIKNAETGEDGRYDWIAYGANFSDS